MSDDATDLRLLVSEYYKRCDTVPYLRDRGFVEEFLLLASVATRK